mmetsp:Transcript_28540/g.66864  ORF Transcript_28540/g.66864 Transcript_28540/m.66864 type:complete len:225 (-) Transcript_28540:37-711(-)
MAYWCGASDGSDLTCWNDSIGGSAIGLSGLTAMSRWATYVYGWSAWKRSRRLHRMPGSWRYQSDVMSSSTDGFTVNISPDSLMSTFTAAPSSVLTSSCALPTCFCTNPLTHTAAGSATHTSICWPGERISLSAGDSSTPEVLRLSWLSSSEGCCFRSALVSSISGEERSFDAVCRSFFGGVWICAASPEPSDWPEELRTEGSESQLTMSASSPMLASKTTTFPG